MVNDDRDAAVWVEFDEPRFLWKVRIPARMAGQNFLPFACFCLYLSLLNWAG